MYMDTSTYFFLFFCEQVSLIYDSAEESYAIRVVRVLKMKNAQANCVCLSVLFRLNLKFRLS